MNLSSTGTQQLAQPFLISKVIHKDVEGAFYHMNYMLEDGSRALEVATTRPETMFGDVAVAVNPEDPRYKDLIGKNVILPIANKLIPIVGDEHADPEFGTGVVKITPAHDPNDFLVGQRHNLPQVNVMNDDGTMNDLAFEFAGMDRFEARKAVVAKLEEIGALVKIEKRVHSVGHSERTGVVVEPRLSTLNGSSRWTNWLKCYCQPRHRGQGRILPTSFQRYLPSMDGKMSTTGLSLVSSGGVTKSLLGTMLRVKCMSVKKLQKVTDGLRTKTSWILGSVLPFGHSQLWAGLMSTQKTSNVTSQLQPW